MKEKYNTTITTRVWKGSILIGKRVIYINERFNVIVEKVSRGSQASDNTDLIIEEADYITFSGNSKDCLELFKETSKKQ